MEFVLILLLTCTAIVARLLLKYVLDVDVFGTDYFLNNLNLFTVIIYGTCTLFNCINFKIRQ